jgi:cysteine desulfurase/selenocysteine lyase
MILRSDFPIFSKKVHNQNLIYFDNASTTQKPQQVLQALTNFYSSHNANIHRGIYALAEEATGLYEDARGLVARFIGATHAQEIVFTSGTTQGINMVAQSWARHQLQPGDEILISEMEHHANLLPWQQLAHEKQLVLKFIPVLPDGTLDYAALEWLLTERTKLVSVVHVSHIIGTTNDIEFIIKKAHAVGACVLIDAAQSVPHMNINVHKLGCDFLVFSGHKMFGPTGIGILYVKKELHEAMRPYQYGGGMVFDATYQHARFQPMPQKLEAGTPAIAQAVGLGAAIRYIQNTINFDELKKHEAALCSRIIDALAEMPKIRLLGPLFQLKKQGHMVSFVVDGVHAHDVAAYLDQFGICVRAGHHCAQSFAKKLNIDASIRVSFYAYNTQEEIETFIHVLQKL